MSLNKDFKEFVALLNVYEVRYLIVGDYAVAFHGHPRYTKDLDIWIQSTKENADRVMSALMDFGFGSSGLSADDFTSPDHVVQLGVPPNRIDLVGAIEGVSFDTCFSEKVSVVVDGITINVISLERLKENKRSVGRPQDLADVYNLTQKSKG